MKVAFKNFWSRIFGGIIGDDPKDAFVPKNSEFEFQEVVMKNGEYVVAPVAPPAKPLTEFERAKANLTVKDMLVISKTKYESLNPEDKEWVLGLGNKVFYFEGATLTNVALIRSY